MNTDGEPIYEYGGTPVTEWDVSRLADHLGLPGRTGCSRVWGLDGSYAETHTPPLTRRERWRTRLRLARSQLRPCWRGWGTDCCGRRRDGVRRAWYALTKARIT